MISPVRSSQDICSHLPLSPSPILPLSHFSLFTFYFLLSLFSKTKLKMLIDISPGAEAFFPVDKAGFGAEGAGVMGGAEAEVLFVGKAVEEVEVQVVQGPELSALGGACGVLGVDGRLVDEERGAGQELPVQVGIALQYLAGIGACKALDFL